MRCTQFIGLSEEAKSFLETHALKTYQEPNCPHCNKPTQFEFVREECGVAHGMYDDDFPLYRYRLRDETTISEYVQVSPWSSGPVIFTSLKKENDETIGDWAEKEIESYL